MSSTAHLLEQHTLADLFTVVYVLVDDYLRASLEAGRFCLPDAPNQKASYSELITIALVGDLVNQADDGPWFDLVGHQHRDLFPLLPHRTRYYRVLRNLERVLADLALCLLAWLLGPDDVYVIDSKPIPICKGVRFKRPRAMTQAATGRGGLGWFYGFRLHAVVNTAGLVCRFAVVPANENDVNVARCLLGPGEAGRVLADKGYQGSGVYAQPRGNFKRPRTWTRLMGKVRKVVEATFSSLTRSRHLCLGQRNSFWSIRASVCRKVAVHNLAYFLLH